MMNPKPLILALDQGTSGSRAFAVEPNGRVCHHQSAVLAPLRPQEGLSEYDAQDLLQNQLDVLHALLDEVDGSQVAALAVTSQRSTVVLWDKTTGRAVAPVLTWEDGRAAQEAAEADLSQEEIHSITGLYKTPYYSAPKIAWCLRHLPLVKKTLEAGNLRVGPVASYLIWRLTGGAVFAVDPTLAQRMLLLDVRTKTWSEKLCRAFGIPPSCLPEILPTAADYGTYEYKGYCFPIRVCAGDQQAAVAFRDFLPGQTCINYGTGAFLLYNAGAEKPVFLPGMLTSLSVSGRKGTCDFLLEGPVNAAGSVLQWLHAQGMSFEAAQADALCRASKHPVWLLPALGGLGAPYWDFSLSAVAAGLSPRTREADWVCGAVRATACLVADIAAYLRANGFGVNGPVYASGGLSRVEWLVQYQADLLQTEMRVAQEAESTVLGAARLAAQSVGWPMAQWQYPPERKVVPQISAAQAADFYRQWQKFVAWCRQYGK